MGRVLFTTEEIESRLDALAAEIQTCYTGRELTIVAVLKGSLIFTADLVRRLDLPVRMDILEISSYFDGEVPSGKRVLSSYVVNDVRGRHVLVVDDILDSGGTLTEVLELVRVEKPASLATCVFLAKRRKRRVDVPIDFCGFEVNARDFVVGYGLDYAQRYRNLPHLAVLERVEKPAKKKSARRKTAGARKTKEKGTASRRRSGGSGKTRKRSASSGRRRKRGGTS